MPSQHEIISTGSLRLDIALGLGGLPCGSIVEIAGEQSAGKTSLCLSILAQAQQLGRQGAFIDVDHSLDALYATRCGVDPDRLLVSEPAHTDQALDTLETLAGSGEVAVIAVDSLTSLVSQEELQRPLGANPDPDQITAQDDARLGLTLRRLSSILPRSRSIVLLIHLSAGRRGPVYRKLAKNPARLALQLHSGIRLEMQTLAEIRQQGQICGHKSRVKIVRNAYQPCQQWAELDIMYEQGIRKTGDVFDLGCQLGLIDRQGHSYRFQDLYLGRNSQEVLDFLKTNPFTVTALEQIIRQRLQSPT
jgi:recombination protein RecA